MFDDVSFFGERLKDGLVVHMLSFLFEVIRLIGISKKARFFTLLTRWEKLAYIRLDILNSISSPLARCLYAFLPSRAWHHGKDNPFEITLTRLLDQVGFKILSESAGFTS